MRTGPTVAASRESTVAWSTGDSYRFSLPADSLLDVCRTVLCHSSPERGVPARLVVRPLPLRAAVNTMDSCLWCGHQVSIAADVCGHCGSQLSGQSPEEWALLRPVIREAART